MASSIPGAMSAKEGAVGYGLIRRGAQGFFSFSLLVAVGISPSILNVLP